MEEILDRAVRADDRTDGSELADEFRAGEIVPTSEPGLDVLSPFSVC